MSHLNKIMLIGHVGAKPEMTRSEAGEAIARMHVVISRVHHRDGQDVEETDWHDVVAFGKLAEMCEQHVDKGRLIYVEGRLQSHTWQDESGVKHLGREVIARRIDMIGRPTAPSEVDPC